MEVQSIIFVAIGGLHTVQITSLTEKIEFNKESLVVKSLSFKVYLVECLWINSRNLMFLSSCGHQSTCRASQMGLG